MRTTTRTLIALGLITVVGIAGVSLARRHAGTHHEQAVYYCPMHPTYTSDRPGNCPICNMRLVKREQPTETTASAQPQAHKILYWTDPMLPGFKADKPGKSPMGMDLVPVYEEEQPHAAAGAAPAGYAPVQLTQEKQQLIGVTTAPAVRRRLAKTIRAAGTIAHDPELYQAQAEYIQAVQALARAQQGAAPDVIEQSRQMVEASRIRLKHLGLSDEMVQEVATASQPEHGLLFAHPGDPVWMYAQVYEYELPLVRVGQEVVVDVPALPGELFHGTVRAIDAMVDMMTRTTRIRAQLQDPNGHLRPDMFVNASIVVDLGEVLAVPAEAVFDTGAKQIVFVDVDQGAGLLEPRDVVLGAKADGYDEVKSGVTEGELVVTSGNFLIDSESRLKGALEGLSGGGHQHGP